MQDRICAIARGAGEQIMRIYDGSYSVDSKADSSPVTCADLAAHAHIERELHLLAPQIPLVSEEGEQAPWETRREWSEFWLVDPLDGTKEFIKRNGEFTVNIALVRDGFPAFGVVYAPALGVMYRGGAGFGAWMEDAEGA
ncbi:MAG TPA: inositol monophosphatase family protein, partial [Verrucomicrobiae bacterium]|nr:inositol monophosphatase family protein [Verrucomicrobiae bacterium]